VARPEVVFDLSDTDPSVRISVPSKYSATNDDESPTASKICAPWYDSIVEMPIFAIVLRRPSSSACR